MKNSIFILLLFVANISFSQIYVEQGTDGSVTISPKGITSAKSKSPDTTNVAFGPNTLLSNISGIYNVAIGSRSLEKLTSGAANVSIGELALSKNTTGGYNISLGRWSMLNNTTGSSNIAMGYAALKNNVIGVNNIAIGENALYSNANNIRSIAIGNNALYYADDISSDYTYNIAIGNDAMKGSTTASANTGLRNTVIGDDAFSAFTTGSGNSVLGFGAGNTTTTGNHNVFLGRAAGDNNTTGSNNIVIGYNAEAPLGIGSNQVRIGNSSIAYAGVQVAWTITSDARLKENIKTLPYGLDFIKNLRPVSYTRKNDENQKLEFGLIAQEFDSVLTKFDIKNAGFLSKDDKGFYSVRYNDLIATLIKAVQEQQQIIEAQTQKTAQLEAKLLAFETKLASFTGQKDNHFPQNSDK